MSVLLFMAAQAASIPTQEPEPDYYICEAKPQSSAFGNTFYSMEVPVDGSAPFHRIQWQMPRREEGLHLVVDWVGAAPTTGPLDDRTRIFVKFTTKQRIRDEVRVEIRRTPEKRYPSQFAYAGLFERPRLWPGSQIYYLEAEGNWGELSAWMKGRESLAFALVKRDGTVVVEDRLDATTLANAATAIAAIRPEVDILVADYRTKCRVPEPIILAH